MVEIDRPEEHVRRPEQILGKEVLVLSSSFEPITICSVKKAMILILLTKADMIATQDGKTIRTVSKSYPIPSVIKLSRYIKIPFKKIELSRKNVIRRDNNRCQYCGSRTAPLTIDHIIPKSRGGEDTWENLVAACTKCNDRKGSRTLEEAGLTLIAKPTKPHHLLFIRQSYSNVDSNWKPYLYMD